MKRELTVLGIGLLVLILIGLTAHGQISVKKYTDSISKIDTVGLLIEAVTRIEVLKAENDKYKELLRMVDTITPKANYVEGNRQKFRKLMRELGYIWGK